MWMETYRTGSIFNLMMERGMNSDDLWTAHLADYPRDCYTSSNNSPNKSLQWVQVRYTTYCLFHFTSLPRQSFCRSRSWHSHTHSVSRHISCRTRQLVSHLSRMADAAAASISAAKNLRDHRPASMRSATSSSQECSTLYIKYLFRIR